MWTDRIQVEQPLDLVRTMRAGEMWGGCSWMRVEEGVVWFAQREKTGPARMALRREGTDLLATAWGPGGEVLLARARAIVGLEGAGVEQIVSDHPVIVQARRKLRGLRVGRSGRLFAQLISTSLGQKVTGKNSVDALWTLARRWGELAPGPGPDLWLLPEPKWLANQPYYAFHPLNIERHRAELVRRIAGRHSALARAEGMAGPDAFAHLQHLRGIGPWTAGIVVGGCLGDPDHVPVGDYNLPGVIGHALAGERNADDERMLELLEPFSGLRGLVARMVVLGGPKRPRRGHRTAVRDIRRH